MKVTHNHGEIDTGAAMEPSTLISIDTCRAGGVNLGGVGEVIGLKKRMESIQIIHTPKMRGLLTFI